MSKLYLVFFFNLLFFHLVGQNTISGVITNKSTKETIIGANIRDTSNSIGCSSNNYGFFSLSFKKFPVTLIVSYIGYKADTLVFLKSNDYVRIELEESITQFSTFEVVGAPSIISNTSIGVTTISTKQLKSLPTLGGESDPIKAFQLMPGVQSGNEGTSSLLVRGGTPDQTLIIMDDVPIYYINHIGGFLSTIDVNTINDIRLIKAGFPAEYGNRLSGIMDIRLKNGNKEKLNLSLELGFVSSKLFIEGPLIHGKTTYMISLRRCNMDLGSRLFFKISKQEYTAGYTFYDGYAKINHTFNSKNSISFSFYNGRDKIYNNSTTPYYRDPDNYINKGETKTLWGNIMFSTKYNHKFSNKLFGSSTMGYSKFGFANSLENSLIEVSSSDVIDNASYSHNSGITDIIVKQDFDYYINNRLKVRTGGSFTSHVFNLGLAKSRMANIENETGINNTHTQELDLYEQNEFEFSPTLRVNIGVHFNSYFVNKKSYFSLQPRVNISKSFKKTQSIKMSFSLMQQNMHLLSNNGAGVPVDLWVPATENIVPQKSSQLSFGYYKVFNKSSIEFSSEVYFKKYSNQIDYKEGINLFVEGYNWESKVVTDGEGKSAGLELLLQKKYGKLNGWIGYTFSYNFRRFDNINNGNWYPFKYDRRHLITLVGNYPITNNITLSSDFVFMTGNAITLPKGYYPTFYETGNSFQITPNNTYIYGGRNSSRMPNYHRLDVSISFKKKLTKGSREWIVSIYNIYSHQNAYYLYFTEDKDNNFHLNQMTLFPIIPSVMFKRNF